MSSETKGAVDSRANLAVSASRESDVAPCCGSPKMHSSMRDHAMGGRASLLPC